MKYEKKGAIRLDCGRARKSPETLTSHARESATFFDHQQPSRIAPKKIYDADVLVCDITRQNQNVYYEIGFAIGAGKAIAPVVNVSFANSASDLRKDGLFDNISYSTYENSKSLSGNIMRDCRVFAA